MPEARLEDTEAGKVPADDGWFILNLADMAWAGLEGGGRWAAWETRERHSTTLGWGVHVLWPGDAPGMYHAESEQEGFLVLSGECIAVVEGQERRMGPWDVFHCPPGTGHITVGAGDGPCALVMVGTRSPHRTIDYIPDAVAAEHGHSVREHTQDGSVAYADRPPITPVPSPWPLGTRPGPS
jgi:uncharacterized cupin superfamily protein